MAKLRTEITEKSFKLGVVAFKSGKMCVPAHDADLMELLYSGERKNIEIGSPDSLENNVCCNSWVQGWTTANLGAGVL